VIGLVKVTGERGLEKVGLVTVKLLVRMEVISLVTVLTLRVREGVREALDPEAGVRVGVRVREEEEAVAGVRVGVRVRLLEEPDPEAGVREGVTEVAEPGHSAGSKGASQNNSVCLMEPEPNFEGALSIAL